MDEEAKVFVIFVKQLYIIIKNTILINFYYKAGDNFIITELLNVICAVLVTVSLLIALGLSVFLSRVLAGAFDVYFFLLVILFVIIFTLFIHLFCNFWLGRFKFSSLDEEMNFCRNSEFNKHKILFPLDDDARNGYVVMVVLGKYSLAHNFESYVIPSVYTKYKNGLIGITGARAKFQVYKLIGKNSICNVRVGRIINKKTKDSMLVIVSKFDIVCTYNGAKCKLLYKCSDRYENINCNIYGVMENKKDKRSDYIFLNGNQYLILKNTTDSSNFFFFS